MISYSLKVKIQELIIKRPSKVASPITNDTILVRDCIMGKKTNRIGKCLIKMYIRELHNDLIEPKNERELSEVWKGNKLLASNISVRCINSINVNKFTARYKEIYECEVCI